MLNLKRFMEVLRLQVKPALTLCGEGLPGELPSPSFLLPSSILVFFLFFLKSATTFAQVFPNLGGQRAGVSTLSFLKTDIAPRSLALSGSNIAISGDGYSALYNPATMADQQYFDISLSNLSLGNDVNQSYLSVIKPLKNSSAFGLSLNTLGSGPMEVRTEFQPDGTGEKFYATNLCAGITYSRSLSDMFSTGLTLKYIYEGLAQYKNHTAAFDLGFLYKTDFREMKFAVLVQNFGSGSKIAGDFIPVKFNRDTIATPDKYTVPTIFKLGVSIVPFKREDQSITTSLQLDHPNDNAENIRMGVEYEFKKLVYIRAGYKINVTGQKFPSFGAGIRTRIGSHPVLINYGVNPTNYLGMQHSFSLSFNINNKGGGNVESK